jgi:hypothetical protein
MKNRFVYNFHFLEYSKEEQKIILQHYLDNYEIIYEKELLEKFVEKIAPVPREIHNFVIKLRDFVVSRKI